jgi:hypothetical protein
VLNKADYNVFAQGLNLGKVKEQALTVSKI